MPNLFRISNGNMLTHSEAEWLFTHLRDETGIPWQPSAEGCWERAHVMIRFMQLAGAQPMKIWVFSGARLNTPSGERVHAVGLKPSINGLGERGWSIHVAPLAWVRDSSGIMERMVFDPIVARDLGPVSIQSWLKLLNDPSAKFGESSARLFKPFQYEVVGDNLVFKELDGIKQLDGVHYDDDLGKSSSTLRKYIRIGN